MKAAITLNDTIRTFYLNFKDVRNVYLDEELDFEENINDSEYASGSEAVDGEIIEGNFTLDKIERKLLCLDGKHDPSYITHEFEFESVEDYLDFTYNHMAFEIFAKTTLTYKDAMNDFHMLQKSFLDKKIKLDLISLQHQNSKPATLFFLAREKCKANTIRFVDDYSDLWKHYNTIITADQFLIESVPKNRFLFAVLAGQKSIQSPKNQHNKFYTLPEITNIING